MKTSGIKTSGIKTSGIKTAAVLLLVFVLSGALCGFGAAHAQGAGSFCPPNRAEETTIAKIAADPAAWLGKCITVTAIYNNERLYSDIDAIYGKAGGSIGGFVDGKGTIEGFWTGKFSGRVADCKVAEDELATGLLRSPGISLDGRTLGCVAPEGPFLLFMSQRDFVPSTLARRLAPTKGNLVPVPAPPDLQFKASRIGMFLEALRNRNTRSLARLNGGSEYAAEQLFADDTAIADLRKPVDRPVQVFKLAEPKDDVTEVVCWCRTKNCSKTWPIALRDADNQVSRPYACVRVRTNWLSADHADQRYDASRDFDGLPEPAASRMR